MSNAQPPQGPPRQPMGYQSPTPYPPAGMAPTHYAFPPQPGPPTDPYRQTPTALPSMRTLDHVPSQQQHPQQHAIPMGAHMAGPLGPGAPMGYYPVPHPAYNIHADPNALRYTIAPGMADPRIALSGGRHKKEIKRRTKTGCLTCRKRRIKCDEAHPTCNNCKKSKRECLGYDPIFKQQQGPTAIQPAPNNQTAAPPTTLTSTPTLQSSASNTYPSQPQVVPSSYPPSVPSSVTFDSPVSSTAQSVKTESGFDYSAAIDPALQGPELSTAVESSSQYRQPKADGEDDAGKHYSKAKKMKVDELIALGGVTPLTPSSSPPSAVVLDEIAQLYNEVYVPGLTLFFESKWYEPRDGQSDASNPIAAIHRNQQLITLFASFIQSIGNVKSSASTDLAYPSHLETSLVWALARLPASVLPANVAHGHGSTAVVEDDAFEAFSRVGIFEALVSGDTLPNNPLSPHATGDITVARKHELEFWYFMAEYLQQGRSSAASVDVEAREHYLGLMRSLLDGRENRDVLYSIAVLREYTPKWDALDNEQTIPIRLVESDARSKLAVATRLIREEAASTGGTTNVVRRLADVAYRAFVRPGVNANLRDQDV
ncbi:transcriptional regulatory protein moc3 [Echria macrotheca]|uniref:Transcriptional regulatory protein moc3 n=1 Tax=Echria macrotheca TaxID=438768 RepID=A0AAJ0FFH6_9PEZI|nr:transcriptional regulatory protein moc3 [Echria macrotheca]